MRALYLAPVSGSDRVADVAFVVLAVVAVVLPCVAMGGLNLYDSQRVIVVSALAVLMASVGSRSGIGALMRGLSAIPRTARLMAALAVSIGLVSSLRAVQPLYGWVEVGLYVAMLALALVLADRWSRDPNSLRPGIEIVVLVSAAVYAVVLLWRHAYYSSLPTVQGWPSGPAGPFSNARFLAQVQLVLLPVLLSLGCRLRVTGGWRGRVAANGTALVAGAHVAALLSSGGRGGLISVAVGAVVAAVVFGRRAKQVWPELARALLVGAIMYVLVFADSGSISGSFDRGSDVLSGRALHWATALKMAASQPLLGVGPMHYAYSYIPYGAHPHNIVLQLAAEWGVIAASLWVALGLWGMGAWLRFAFRTRGESERVAWRMALTWALIGSLVNAMVDSFVMTPPAQVWAILLLGALWAELTMESSKSERTQPIRQRWWFVTPLVLMMAIAPPVIAVVKDGPKTSERAAARSEWLPSSRMYPRFWQVGALAPPEGPPASLQMRYGLPTIGDTTEP